MPGLTSKQEKFLNLCVKGKWKLNSSGIIDVDGDVVIKSTLVLQELGIDVSDRSKQIIKDLWGIRFGCVRGSFIASDNRFENLSGFPLEVSGELYLTNSLSPRIQNLKGLTTKKVGGDFDVKIFDGFLKENILNQ